MFGGGNYILEQDEFGVRILWVRIEVSMTREQIKSAALDLDPAERQALAEEILLSVTGEDRSVIDAAWLAEARRRVTPSARRKPVDLVIDRLKNKSRQ